MTSVVQLQVKLQVFLVFVLCVFLPLHGRKISYCHCPNREDCSRMVPDKPEDKEVYVLTNGSSQYEKWDWNTVSAVIATEDFTDDKVMCYAHKQQVKYGFMVDIPVYGDMNYTNPDVKKWLTDTTSRVATSLADLIIINLMPVLLHPVHEYKTQDLVQTMAMLKASVYVKVDCVVPWKPPFKDGETQSLTSQLARSCDHFILSPESYMDIKGYSCKARATVPMTKLVLGIDEYVSDGIHEKKLILGVPWHGYDYPCKSLNDTTEICELNYIGNTSVCDLMTRTKLPLANFLIKPEIHNVRADQWSDIYKAPFHSYWENFTDGTPIPHQRWMEDVESLRLKYMYAKDLKLKGIAVWTGDDMTYADIDYYQMLNSEMWTWILHDLLGQGKVTPRNQIGMYYANTVTAAALGCLFGGLLLGVMFTCLVFKRIKKGRKPPFQQDRDDLVDDFHDDDLNL